jgi:hypothetical protein
MLRLRVLIWQHAASERKWRNKSLLNITKMAATTAYRLQHSIINHEIEGSNPVALSEQEKLLEKCSLPKMIQVSANIAKSL